MLQPSGRGQRMQGVLGYLQGPRDAAVTLETAPVLEVPTVRVLSLRNLLPPSAIFWHDVCFPV